MAAVQVVGVAAAGPAEIVGRGLSLPWRCPADLRWFRFVTDRRPVIVGRKTFEGLPPLPGRSLFVLSSTNPGGRCAGWSHSPEELLVLAAEHGPSVVVAGGPGCWAAFDHLIDEWLISEIGPSWMQNTPGAPVFFGVDLAKFQIVSEEDLAFEVTVRHLRC